MIDTGIEPLQISDTERVSFYYDTYTMPLEEVIGYDVGVYTIRISRDYNDLKQGEASDDLDRLMRGVWYSDHYEVRERAIERYLSMFGYTYHKVSLQGYSQSEWAEVFIYIKDDYDLSPTIASLRAWWSGDVYIMAQEQLEIYTNLSNGEIIERWETQDSLGGVIADSAEELHRYARETFALAVA